MNNISPRALHGVYFRARKRYNIKAMRNAAARGEAGGEDRLSELPDDILLNILERVDTLDALRTCILSRRLLRLPAVFSRFDLDIASLEPRHDEASHGFFDVTRHDNALAAIADPGLYGKALAAVTEKILCVRNNPDVPIRKLRVRCYVRPDECLPITRALASTMATHKVNHAEFVPLVEKHFSRCNHKDLVCYATRFNACLSGCPAAFAGLTRLYLRNMRFGQLDIPNILGTCKRLEYLHLLFCDAGLSSVLLVEHDQLVELVAEQGNFEVVDLSHVPKLQRLTCAGWCYPVTPLTFGHVPQLSKLRLRKRGHMFTPDIQLSQLLANVPSISDLHLNFRSEKIWVIPEHPKLLGPMLRKLETVNLDNLPERCDIAWTIFILEAAPCLRKLCITVQDHVCNMVTDQDARGDAVFCDKVNVEWQSSASAFKHKNLLNLTIHGFQMDESFVRYVRRIMEVAVNMQEVWLRDKKACGRCGDLNPKIKVYPTTDEERDMLRVEITKGLGLAGSPAVIHFRS